MRKWFVSLVLGLLLVSSVGAVELNVMSVQSCKYSDIYLAEVNVEEPELTVYAMGEMSKREPDKPRVVFVFNSVTGSKKAVEVRGEQYIPWEAEDWFKMYPTGCSFFDKEKV